MDETTVRKSLAAIREELARFDDERNVLVNLVRNYETWLRIHGKDVTNGTAHAARPEPPKDLGGSADGSGGPSFRGSVLRVIREAHGEPLHAKEILRRVEALGARSNAKNQLSVISLAIRGLSEKQPIEKAGPRMWRWAGTEDDPGPVWLLKED
jgi:hypothetical protein